KALLSDAIACLIPDTTLFDPTLAEQPFDRSWTGWQSGRFYPSCSSQLLHQLALPVVRDGHFIAFGRSTRTSRNSSGPLVSRRRRWARSSGWAEGSPILSIASAASSAPRSARLPAAGAVFTASP